MTYLFRIMILALLLSGCSFLIGCSVFERKVSMAESGTHLFCTPSDAHPWACDGFLILEE
jgi:uncharacterized protein YceK